MRGIGKQDISSLTSYLTTGIDSATHKYEREREDTKRGFIIACTTNSADIPNTDAMQRRLALCSLESGDSGGYTGESRSQAGRVMGARLSRLSKRAKGGYEGEKPSDCYA